MVRIIRDSHLDGQFPFSFSELFQPVSDNSIPSLCPTFYCQSCGTSLSVDFFLMIIVWKLRFLLNYVPIVLMSVLNYEIATKRMFF